MSQEPTIAVVGLGYVGLPAALHFARTHHVVGIDNNSGRINQLQQGKIPFFSHEPGLEELAKQVEHNFTATTNYSRLAGARAILICVDTPPTKNHFCDYDRIKTVLTSIADYVSRGTLISIESTLPPTSLDRVLQPFVDDLLPSRHIGLVHAPERVRPGKLIESLRTNNRLIGGKKEVRDEALVLYRRAFQDDPVRFIGCSATQAEFLKTAENASRTAQIVAAHVLARLCEGMGASFWDIQKQIPELLSPGPGIGGHCLPKDTYYLVDSLHQQEAPSQAVQFFLQTAAIMQHMPYTIVDKVQDAATQVGKSLAQTRLVLLGYAYKADSCDARDTPAEPIIKELRRRGAQITVHDPYVHTDFTQSGDFISYLKDADGIVVVTDHTQYKTHDLAEIARRMNKPSFLVDARHIFSRQAVEAEGIAYHGVGESLSNPSPWAFREGADRFYQNFNTAFSRAFQALCTEYDVAPAAIRRLSNELGINFPDGNHFTKFGVHARKNLGNKVYLDFFNACGVSVR